MTTRAFRRSVSILLCGAALAAAHASAQRAALPEPPPNFDIRVEKTPEAVSYLTRFTTPPDAVTAAARLTAMARLQKAFSGIVIESSPETGVPEIVGVPPGSGFLTAATPDRAGALRTFLASYAPIYGLTAPQVAELGLVADYVNPAGNMAWVEFEQRVNGLPVFGGLLRGGFTASGELVRTTGQLGANLDGALLPSAPALSATQAIGHGAASVNWALRQKMVDEARSWLVYFPMSPGIAQLAWAMEIWGDPDAFLILVDAFDGTVLFRKNLTNYQSQPVTYHVYDDDSPAPMSPSTALPGGPGTQAPLISRSMITLIGNEGPNAFNNLGWINDGLNITDGNNAEAGLDRNGVDGVDAPVTGSSFRVFNFSYNPAPGNPAPGDSPLTIGYQNGEVTHAFYWANLFHDKLYLLGFTEAARNFQNDNFGRGGLGADRLRVEIQDSTGVNNANFLTPTDGGRGRLQMYIFTGPAPARGSGLDTEVLIHELTHGTSQRLHNNGLGLTTNMSGGMGEGWSDLFARVLLSTPDEDINGRYAYGAWITYGLSGQVDNYYYGFRRFPYALMGTVGANGRPHNPLTFADIDPNQMNVSNGAFAPNPNVGSTATLVHNAGEVWASALLEVRARMIARLGFAAGNQHFLQIVIDGMKLDPINPTYLQGRDAILAAAAAGGGDVVADANDIWAGFAVRGMGFSAQVLNAATNSVVEAFDVPGLAGNGGSIVAESIPNGSLDSGETVTLSLCITNTAAATSGPVTGTLFASGGVLSPSGPQSYGTVAPAGSVCRTFSVVVGPTCGGTMTATLQAQEIGGGGQTRNLTYPFTVGQAFLSQNFDGVTAPALPAGWTTSTLGGSVNLWATTTTSPDTPPNKGFVNNPSTISDNVLDSPLIAVPAGSSYVSFRNRWQTSNVFDGGVLEIAINGGAFADIVAAGGAFLTGGYNGTIATGFGNPIGGRQAWSGIASSYVTTTVALPPSAAGQNIVLRWRMGTDSGGSGTGWSIDTIVAYQCGSQAPVITTHPQSRTVMSGQTATLTVVAAGTSPLTYQWYQGVSGNTASPVGGATSSSYTTPALVAPASYWVRVSNSAGTSDSNTASLTIGPAAGVNLIANGDFSAAETGWSVFEEPDIVHNVTGGVFQFYRANPTTTPSGQATIFQATGQPIAAFSQLTATFSIGNSSTARKRITVLILDSDFSDLAACTFWLEPAAPIRGYYMVTRPTKPWANAAMYFYAATKGQDGGFYQLDNVTLRQDGITAPTVTRCGDQTVPPADPFGVASGNLLGNGQFLGDTLAPWSTFGSLTWQIDGGIFEFNRPSPLPAPAGVIFQNTGQPMAANTIMSATMLLGNSTSVRRRVTVLLQDADFSDLTACTFWLAPYQPLGAYAVRGFSTKPWVNATLAIYAASVGTQTWMRLGNVTLARTPATAIDGTNCVEPAVPPALLHSQGQYGIDSRRAARRKP